MKDRMERLVVFPFTAGCVSSSSVSVCIQHGRRPKEDINTSHIVCRSREVPKDHKDTSSDHHQVCRSREVPKDHKDTSSDHMMKGSSRLSAVSKPNIYIGFHRLTRSIKSLSQSLVFKETEEVEMEMEIGLPTDVKHVTHIGFDGSTTRSANDCNDNSIASDLLSLYPDFVAQYEKRDTFVTMDATFRMQDKSFKSPEIRGN